MNHFTPFTNPRPRIAHGALAFAILITILVIWDGCAVVAALVALDRQYSYEDRV